ncbi:hypothetical protein [Stenotrophomonas sp.]|uniref:hypothetical protein n=1 Tax=Stenotrophomonas sp. TaxID=69392 RepID=UPI00289FD893|nr:hypothetical protein [Stenotrophomonas sp.]
MRAFLIIAIALLAACQSASGKLNAPAPVFVEVPVATYVPIDAALTKRCNWVRAGKPSAVFEVSNGRKRCLELYEAQLEGIEQVQAKPAPARVD